MVQGTDVYVLEDTGHFWHRARDLMPDNLLIGRSPWVSLWSGQVTTTNALLHKTWGTPCLVNIIKLGSMLGKADSSAACVA